MCGEGWAGDVPVCLGLRSDNLGVKVRRGIVEGGESSVVCSSPFSSPGKLSLSPMLLSQLSLPKLLLPLIVALPAATLLL